MTIALENCEKHLQNFKTCKKSLKYFAEKPILLNFETFPQCFVQYLLRKLVFISNSAQITYALHFWQILVSWKPLSMVEWIFKVNEFWQTPKFDIFQEALFFTLVSSTNLLLEAVQVGAVQNLVNPLITNPTKWSSTLKRFVGICPCIFSVYLTISLGWRLKC